jgi:hypothetical protein
LCLNLVLREPQVGYSKTQINTGSSNFRSQECLQQDAFPLLQYAPFRGYRLVDSSQLQPQLWYVLMLSPSSSWRQRSCNVYELRTDDNLSQVKAGDAIPSVELFEDSPGNKVNIADLLKTGKGVIIGVPAAFSPGCSDTHIPGYMNSDKLKDAGNVFVVSVNDAFV